MAFIFYGNPNVTTSSVDVNTNGIVASRTSGVVPFFCQVSASGVLCTGTNANGNPVLPYEDLMFSFDGDVTAGHDTVVNPTNNLGTVVSTCVQAGPEATFCYRTPGTYTITMTVWYQTAPGVYASTTKILSVTATAFSGTTRYLDTNLITGANNGTSPANAWQAGTAVATLNTWLGGGSNRKLSVAQGSVYTVTSGSSLGIGGNNQSTVHLDNYVGSVGASVNPVFKAAGAPKPAQLCSIYFVAPNNGNCTDYLVSGIDVINDGSSTCSAGIGGLGAPFGTCVYSYVYVDSCNVTNTKNVNWTGASISGIGSLTTAFGCGFWKCVFTSPIITSGSSFGVHGIYNEFNNWWSVIGCSISGSGSDPNRDHYIYPECNSHSHYRWITFGETGIGNAQWDYCINMNCGDTIPTAGQAATVFEDYHLIRDNRFGVITPAFGGQSGRFIHDLSSASNEPASSCFRNVVTENNFITGITSGSFGYFNQASHTLRDNKYYNCATVYDADGRTAGAMHTQFYRNKIYKPSGTSGNAMPDFFGNNTQAMLIAGTIVTPVNTAFSTAATGGILPTATTFFYRVSALNQFGETLASTETSILTNATLPTPVNAAFSTATTGGSLAAGTYYYRVSAITAAGETLASTETSQVTTGSTSTVTVKWGAVTGATGYRIYGRTTGAELFIAAVGVVTSYTDDGSITPSGALPSSNTATTTLNTVTVKWGAVTAATGYKIYGRTTGAELLIATVGAVTSYTDTGSITPSGALPASNTTTPPALSPVIIFNGRNGCWFIGTALDLTLTTVPGTLPNGKYYVIANAFDGVRWNAQLSTTKGGSPITYTGATGTCTLATNWGYCDRQSFFNNSVWDARTTTALWTLHSIAEWDPSNNNSIIDNNNYYLPAGGATPNFVFQATDSTSYPYSKFSGSPNLLDVHATFNATTWSDPVNGIFDSAARIITFILRT